VGGCPGRISPAASQTLREDPFLITNTISKTKSKKAKGPSKVKVSEANIQNLTQVFKILADNSRMKILMALAQEGEMHVTALCDLLKQSQPAVSHHLTLMRMTGLVGYRRDGKHNYYYLESHQLRDLLDQVFADYGNSNRQIQFQDFALTYKRHK
jgi:ArsR family transcriptional regulator